MSDDYRNRDGTRYHFPYDKMHAPTDVADIFASDYIQPDGSVAITAAQLRDLICTVWWIGKED